MWLTTPIVPGRRAAAPATGTTCPMGAPGDKAATAARRFRVAVLAVAAAEAALAIVALPTGLTPYLLACAVVTAALALAAYRLMTPRRDEGRGDDGGPGGPGGPPEDGPPPWWPEFEAEFRRHTAERERPSGRPHVRV